MIMSAASSLTLSSRRRLLPGTNIHERANLIRRPPSRFPVLLHALTVRKGFSSEDLVTHFYYLSILIILSYKSAPPHDGYEKKPGRYRIP